MSSPVSWTSARAKLASLHREHDPGSPVILEARRDLRAARLEDHVARIVAEAPPLTPEQCDRIAALLRPTAGGASR